MTDTPIPRTPSLLARAIDSDIFYSFRRSKLTMVAAAIVFVLLMMALLRLYSSCRIRSTRRSSN